MAEYTSLSIPQDVKTLLDEEKREDETRGQQLKRLLKGDAFVPPGPMSDEDIDAAVNKVCESMQKQYEVANTPVEGFEIPDSEVEQAKSDILNRLDDLEAQLPRKVAEELR